MVITNLGLIHETLVILGANRQKTYPFAASKAGARGLSEFIPSAYKRIVGLYPHAGPGRAFIRGMEDHDNAAKASLLLFDTDLRIINNGRSTPIPCDYKMLGRVLAAAYNCGSGKTRGALIGTGKTGRTSFP